LRLSNSQQAQPLLQPLASTDHESRFNQPPARAEALPGNRDSHADEPEQREHELSAEITFPQLGLAHAELLVVEPNDWQR
jgi:hypothetical protein